MTELRKAEGLPRETRQRIDKASRELQLEILKSQNPRGAEEYERAHMVAA